MNDRDVREFEELKEKVDGIKAKVEQAKGVRAQILKGLKETHGCSSIEAAEKKLRVKKKERVKAKEKYEKVLEEFKERWEEHL